MAYRRGVPRLDEEPARARREAPRDHGEGLSPREAFALRASIAFVWLATGLLVLHPSYRALGGPYLARLGAPLWLMPATCAAEVLLAVWLLGRPAGRALAALQVGMVSVFTLLLAITEPRLLVHPLGVLTKNLPFVAAVGALFLHERGRPAAHVLGLLRAGMAIIWLTEGVFPKLVFQDAWELGLVTRLGLPGSPSLVVGALGVAQATSGVLALALAPWRDPSRRPAGLAGALLRLLLGAQLVALLVLPTLVGVMDPGFVVHPFGPLTKNAPLVVGTLLLFRRCSTSR